MYNEIIPHSVQIGFITLSLLYLGGVLLLVRKGSLKVNYALLWIFSAIVSLILSLFPDLLKAASDLAKIKTPSNLLFAESILFIVLIILSLSVHVSKQSEQNRRLVQELALQRQEIERHGIRKRKH